MKRGARVLVGTAIAAAAGYVTGVLTAPKSGKETRQDIHDGAAKAKTEAEKKLKDTTAELGKLLDTAKTKVTSAEHAVKDDLHKAIDSGTTARNKARAILSAFHEGESDDKDLQKAVKDVHKAIDHLKSYIDKNVPKKK